MTDHPLPAPALVKVGSVASLALGGVFVLMAVFISLGFGDTAALTSSSLGSWAIPFWCVANFLGGTLLVIIGWGMRKRQPWARPLAVLFWAFNGLLAGVQAVLEAPTGTFRFGFVWLGGLAIAAWYFYVKSDVVSYYEELANKVNNERTA
jgi:hypothetical protein